MSNIRLVAGIRIANIHPGWVQTDISQYNDQAPLTPKDSAERIYNFMVTDFENGVYWDAEAGCELTW